MMQGILFNLLVTNKSVNIFRKGCNMVKISTVIEMFL